MPGLITQAAVLALACAKPTHVAPSPATEPSGTSLEVAVVDVGDASLHYVDHGSGEPIVFVHGGLADYREFLPTMAPLADRFRVIAYSRRHNAPNTNPSTTDGSFSATSEAQDLIGLLDALELHSAHLVGSSYGALTALFVALDHPERVRTLVLAEPPIYGWLPEAKGGAGRLEAFMAATRDPAAAACRSDDVDRSLDIALTYLPRPACGTNSPRVPGTSFVRTRASGAHSSPPTTSSPPSRARHWRSWPRRS